MRAKAIATCLSLLVAGLAPTLARAEGATDVAGVPASSVGVNGPTADYAQNLTVVGHSKIEGIRPDGKLAGGPLGNNGGIALIGDCAYVGRWHEYNAKYNVQIVDVNESSPTFTQVVGSVPNSVINGGVSREIRAIDLPNFKMLTVLTFGQSVPDRTHNFLLFFTFPSGDCRAPVLTGSFDMKALRGHEFFQWLDPKNQVDGHPRILEYVTTPVGPGNIIVVDASKPAEPMLIGAYQDVQPVVSPHYAVQGLGTYAHSISLTPDGTEAYISDWDGGFFTLDTTACTLGVPACALVPKGSMSVPLRYDAGTSPLVGDTHSAVALPGTNAVVVGDEIYATTDGCPFGWMHIIDKGTPAIPASQISEFKLPENSASACGPRSGTVPQLGDADPTATSLVNERNASGLPIDGTFTMHNQTVTGHFVFVTWYGGGFRVVNLTDPSHPTEAGMFVPAPVAATKTTPDTSAPIWGADAEAGNDWLIAMWSYPIIRNGRIYVCDMRNGLYILAPTAGAPFSAEVASTAFVEGNSNFGAFVS